MKNYDAVDLPESVPTKAYVDARIAVQASEPIDGAEIWIDTDEPDPTLLLYERIASLEARVANLESRLE